MRDVKVNVKQNLLTISAAVYQQGSCEKAVLNKALESDVRLEEYFSAKARLHAQWDAVVYSPVDIAMEAGWLQ